MTRFIALLRGINVGGKVVKMEALRGVFGEMGFDIVKTYIQSGNVMFAAEEASASRISEKLEEAFGFPIPVVLRTLDEWKGTIDRNPFAGKDPYITFLSDEPDLDAVASLESFADGFDDDVKVVGREAYLLCPGGYGRTKFSNAFVEKRLAVSGTTRNWKTVNKLLALSQS